MTPRPAARSTGSARIVTQEVTGLPLRAPPGQRHADRGRAPLDGDLGRRRRDGASRRAAARPRRRRARRGAAHRAPGRRQAAPPADRAGQGAGQRDRCGLLRRRAGRALRPRPRRRRRGHPPGGASSEGHGPRRHPTGPARHHPGRARRRADPRAPGPRGPSWSRSPPRATAARPAGRRRASGGTGVFVGALRDALLRRRGRRRGALAQGPPDLPPRRRGRSPPSRSARTRATSWSPATA